MTTFKWKIEAIEYVQTENNFNKVVKSIHWRIVATENEHMAYEEDVMVLPEPNSKSYIPFEQLTNEDEDYLGLKMDGIYVALVNAIKEQQKQIEELKQQIRILM